MVFCRSQETSADDARALASVSMALVLMVLLPTFLMVYDVEETIPGAYGHH